jgi:hypothetical protein
MFPFCRWHLILFLAVALVVPTCGSAQDPPQENETGIKPFPAENVFLGKGENDAIVVEAHYRSQKFDGGKSFLTLMFLPTENFEFEEEYRGFSRITFYKVKKNEKLGIAAGEASYEYKLRKSYTARSIEAFDLEFERKKAGSFVPDVIDSMSFPFKGVVKWEKVGKDDLGRWSRTKEGLKEEAEKRRDARKKQQERQKQAGQADFASEGALWVSVNSTYVFEKKDPASKILAKLPLGTSLEKVKREGTEWVQVFYGDPPISGYVPALMLASSSEEALAWEEQVGLPPVDTPLETVSESAPALAPADTAATPPADTTAASAPADTTAKPPADTTAASAPADTTAKPPADTTTASAPADTTAKPPADTTTAPPPADSTTTPPADTIVVPTSEPEEQPVLPDTTMGAPPDTTTGP